ncbi:PIG-L family deacetylase [Streptomyces sp. NPDC055080]
MAACALVGLACSPVPGSVPGPGTTPVPSRQAADAKDPRPRPRTLVGVAHPDDDLFFLNPEIRRTIRAGCPVDTVYLTSGDGGIKDRLKASEYVDRGEYGVRAAYAGMAEGANRWERTDVSADAVRTRSYRLAARTAGRRVQRWDSRRPRCGHFGSPGASGNPSARALAISIRSRSVLRAYSRKRGSQRGRYVAFAR